MFLCYDDTIPRGWLPQQVGVGGGEEEWRSFQQPRAPRCISSLPIPLDPEAAPKTNTPYSPTLPMLARTTQGFSECPEGGMQDRFPSLLIEPFQEPHAPICPLKVHQEDDVGHEGCGQWAQPLSAVVWP